MTGLAVRLLVRGRGQVDVASSQPVAREDAGSAASGMMGRCSVNNSSLT